MKKILFLYFIAFLSTSIFSQEKNEKINKPPKRQIIKKNGVLFRLIKETELHDATWLQWPHSYQYGIVYVKKMDKIWLDITKALVNSEKVNIIVYNESEKNRVIELLKSDNVTLTNISFKIFKTDNCLIRDNGPIFSRDKNGVLYVGDWSFNGWGKKSKYYLDDLIPTKIAVDQNIPISDYKATLTIEGSSIQMDKYGTILATKSFVLNNNRNLNRSQQEVEKIFKKHFGATKFIWFNRSSNVSNSNFHIDNFARFANDSIIITMNNNDLLEWHVPAIDIKNLNVATNDVGISYKYIILPLTKKNIVTTYGRNIGYKGSYIDYYTANTIVLVPNYNDENDKFVNEIIHKIYPLKKVIGIDIRNLAEIGASIRNITLEQPIKILNN